VIADGRVRGDPYVALTDLAQRIVPDGYADWDYDIVPYYVERRYDYPRFLCYDCHSYASYRYWDPYAYSCVRFRIVVFDDPYYYPYRYYGGRRVVFTRPFRPEPRFIFKDRGGIGDDRFVTRERQRPVNDNGRRGVRGADLGRRGAVPVPDVRRRGRDERPDVTPRRPERPQPQQQPDQRQQRPEPRQAEPRVQPRVQPQRDRPRAETQRDRPRAEPQRDRPRAEPQRDRPRAEPQRDRPQAEPQRDRTRAEPRRGREAAPSKGRPSGQPELRRRRP
jgi:hypothetical protein